MGVGKLFEATGELIREVEKWGAFTAGSSGGKIWSSDVTHEYFQSVEGVKSWIERSRARGQSHLEYSATPQRRSVRNDPTDDFWGSEPPFAGLGNSSPVQAFLSEATNMRSRDSLYESLWHVDEYSCGPRSYPSLPLPEEQSVAQKPSLLHQTPTAVFSSPYTSRLTLGPPSIASPHQRESFQGNISPSKQGQAGQPAHEVEPYEEEDAVGDAELVRKLQEMNFSCDPDMLSPSPSKPKTGSPVNSLPNYAEPL